ncbi:M20 metallopeptidase family protein [Brevibacterium album]|uniref:M20 metallopeptidase family protein n=1 Tax=Brevibacterium album TaxID=417948 RepID=UPI0004033871|nr:M20 family metallopeptidase [Brevibacterium album]
MTSEQTGGVTTVHPTTLSAFPAGTEADGAKEEGGPRLPAHADADALVPRLQELRRAIHREAEVGLELPATQRKVLDALTGLELEIATGERLGSVVAVLRGGRRTESHQAVLLRADMDALPVAEATGFDFASPLGTMHACGHDLHVAGLVGAAHLLHGVRAHLAGDVVFMFQPGEEGYDGAGKMLDEGVLDAAGVPVVGAYGVHVSADQPLGHAYTREGSYMAAFSAMDVTVRGRGGHASRPEDALDPIEAGAALIGQLQEYLSRAFNAFDPVVLTVGSFHGGTATNVIPDAAQLSISVRTFSPEVTARCAEELPRFAERFLGAHGLGADIAFETRLPATVNDHAEARFFLETFGELFGEDRAHAVPHPRAGSEDFSRVLARVQGAYGHLGAALPGTDPAAQEVNHSPRARHSDEGLGANALFLAHLAARRLERAAAQAELG